MACTDGQRLYSRLESDFNIARAVPAERAALGLMAVLRCWMDAGNAGRVTMSASVCHDVVAAVWELRMQKSAACAAGLEGSGLVPVGMGAGTVPWRYTCRLPGIDWNWQHRLGEEMRSHGLNVSHWYLPVHWMCGYGSYTLPGTERLAREVFQFWVDDHTSLETIERGAAEVSEIVRSYNASWG